MTRLADVTRPVGQAFFTPIIRPRILQRIDAAAAGQIVLIVAPAGYGKSLALSQWLANRAEASLRFDVQPEHDTLLGFARGMAEACAPASPSLVKTVTTAAKSSAAADAPGIEMARWMAANLEDFNGLIAIDDFHRTGDEPEVSRFVSDLIARTKRHVKWVIATRSTLDLPVASWLGYGDVHFILGERELVFSDDETHALADGTGEALPLSTLRTIMDVTAGWPVALGLALRSPALLGGETALASATRDVVFEYLAEQVYNELRSEERELLRFACYLPVIQSGVLEAAGYRDWAPILEAIRRRATFLTLERPGMYKCHDLFREFLQCQIETTDPSAARRLQSSAAQALEQVGNTAAALRLYTKLSAHDDILRLLREYGFSLMDHSQGDIVQNAIVMLPQSVRTNDAAVLGLRAQREADLRHFTRAQTLFEKVLMDATAGHLAATIAIRYAVVMLNGGREAKTALESALRGGSQQQEAEIYGLLAVDDSICGRLDSAKFWIAKAERTICALDDDSVRARVSLRIAVAGLNIGGEPKSVREAALSAAHLAERAGLVNLAGRAYTVLASQALFLEDDSEKHIQYAEIAKNRAVQSGDADALATALLQLAQAETLRGNELVLEQLLREIRVKRLSEPHQRLALTSEAILLIWRNQIDAAVSLMERFAAEGYGYYDFNAAEDMAFYAMCCSAAGLYERALSLCRSARHKARETHVPHIHAKHSLEIAQCLCAGVEVMAGLGRQGWRALHTARESGTAPTVGIISDAFLSLHGRAPYEWPAAADSELARLGAGRSGLRKTITACITARSSLGAIEERTQRLTEAELRVMRLIDRGISTKEAADKLHRSIHTVRTLAQRAITKLGCRSRQEALRLLRDRGDI